MVQFFLNALYEKLFVLLSFAQARIYIKLYHGCVDSAVQYLLGRAL